MTLGERIYQLRTQAGLSQEALAEKTGVSRQSVSKWETDASTPELEKLIQLSKIFGITLDSLVQDEPQEPERPVPPVEIVPHTSGFFTPARIVGTILLAAALFGGLFSLIFLGDFTVFILLVCGYFLLCGLICIAARKNAGLIVLVTTLVCVLLIVLLFSIFSMRRISTSQEYPYIESVTASSIVGEP